MTERDRLTKRDEFGNADIIGVSCADLQFNLNFSEINSVTNALNKLADYEDAEETGTLVRLPCKVGDTVYIAQMCMEDLMSDALDHVNRQNAEIERLKQENKEYCEDNRIIAYQRNQRDKEIRALHNQLNGLNFMDKQIKSEAIKEFADRLKNEMRLEDDCQYDCMGCLYACKEYVPMIDNLVKEMTEVQENGK